MIWVDNAIVAIITIYSVSGLIQGLKKEGVSLIVLIVAVVVAWFFSYDFEILLRKTFSAPSTRLAAAFVALTLITLMVGAVLNLLLTITDAKNSLTFLERLGGLVLGFGYGLMVTFALIIVSGLTPLPKDHWWQQSKFIPPFQSLATLVKDNVSSKLASSINYR